MPSSTIAPRVQRKTIRTVISLANKLCTVRSTAILATNRAMMNRPSLARNNWTSLDQPCTTRSFLKCSLTRHVVQVRASPLTATSVQPRPRPTAPNATLVWQRTRMQAAINVKSSGWNLRQRTESRKARVRKTCDRVMMPMTQATPL